MGGDEDRGEGCLELTIRRVTSGVGGDIFCGGALALGGGVVGRSILSVATGEEGGFW